MGIWQIFSNFVRFLHKIRLFCPKMYLSGYIQPDTIAYILHKVMDYPRANCYTIWLSNINTTNIFQFLAIFAKNFAILPQKPDVPHFPEVYQSFLCKLTLIQVKKNSHLLSSKNSHDGTQGPPLISWFSKIFLKFQFLFYKFKDIPRRFLPCSYIEFNIIDQ